MAPSLCWKPVALDKRARESERHRHGARRERLRERTAPTGAASLAARPGPSARVAGERRWGTDEALRITCYPTSLDELDQFHSAVVGAFPKALFNFVQPQRATLASGATCEAVGRSIAPRQPPGAGRLVFTSAQLAFGTTPADAEAGVRKTGEDAGAGRRVVQTSGPFVRLFAVAVTAEVAARAGSEFFDPAKPPARTVLLVEGLPSLDAFVRPGGGGGFAGFQ